MTNVISGYNSINYRVNAKQGQAMTVQLMTTSGDLRFNIYAPRTVVGRDTPLFASEGRTTYTGVLPETGTYVIETFISSKVNRRGKVAPFRMRITIPPAVVNNPPQPDDGGHGPDQWQVTGVAGLLNVRTGPGTNYAIAGTIRGGSIVTNEGCRGTGSTRWCKISSNIVNGWVSGVYLCEYAGGGTTTPPPTPSTPPTTGQKYFQIWNVTTAVNVRSGPGTSYPRVGSVSRGSIVENNGCAGAWCRIKTLQGTGPIISGWISEPYFREYTPR